MLFRKLCDMVHCIVLSESSERDNMKFCYHGTMQFLSKTPLMQLHKRYQSLLSFVLEPINPQEREAAVLCVNISLIVGSISLLVTPLYYVFLHSAVHLVVGFVYAGLTLCTPLLLRASRSLVLIMHYFIALLALVIVIFCGMMGGITSPVISCLYVLPVHAMIALGQRAMVAWIGIVLVILLAFGMLPLMGITLTPVVDESFAPLTVMITFVVVVGTIAIVMKVANDARLRSQRLLEMEKEVVQRANAELDSMNEQLVDQNNRLTALNEEKNSVMGVLAHDLRNPLSHILFFSAALRRNHETKLTDEDIDRYATMIHEGAERMNALIQHLLEAHRLETQTTEVKLQRALLNRVLPSLIAQHEAAAAAKGMVIVLRLPEDELCVEIDEMLFAQVVDNLLSNAIKYATLNSEIQVQADRTIDTVQLSVRNEGRGIAPEELPKLFQKFSRLSTTPTGNEDSVGLGLAIVKHCVERMRGRIWCESVFGVSATFIAELPLLDATDDTLY
jgi:signal transduction histidine kinase